MTISLLLVLVPAVAGCEPRLLPSRGMTVDVAVAETQFDEVVSVVVTFLRENSFTAVGGDGYEVLSGRSLVISYERPNEYQIAIGLAEVKTIEIRMNSRAERWDDDANAVFDGLAETLESRWPGAVKKQPSP